MKRSTGRWGLAVLAALAVGGMERAAAAGCMTNANQVTVWVDVFQGTCRTFEIGNYLFPSNMSPVPNDSISSLTVGANVRAILLHDDANAQYLGGAAATYEPGSYSVTYSGSSWLGVNVQDQASAVIVEPLNGVHVPTYFRGNYPNDREHQLSEELQGVCHTSQDWIFSKNATPSGIIDPVTHLPILKPALFRVHLNQDLNVDNPAVQSIIIPDLLWNAGYNHFGDPDCMVAPGTTTPFVFVPLEADNGLQAGVAVFRGDNLAYVNADVLYVNDDNRAGWVAIDPSNKVDLLTSRTALSGSGVQGVFKYGIDWSQVVPGGGYIFFAGAGPIAALPNRLGFSLDVSDMQGGVFSSDGNMFFLQSSEPGNFTPAGLFVFKKLSSTQYAYVAETGNDFGLFDYQTSCCGQEQEGIDYLHTTSAQTPHIDGDLHAILLNNNAVTSDSYWFKHFSLP